MNGVLTEDQVRWLEKAEDFATLALADKESPRGGLLIDHARRVSELGFGFPERLFGWLHDLVEDTDVTLDQIRDIFGNRAHNILDALTRRKGEQYFKYIERIITEGDWVAQWVKLNDIKDHLATGTIPESLSKRYEKAYDMILDNLMDDLEEQS